MPPHLPSRAAPASLVEAAVLAPLGILGRTAMDAAGYLGGIATMGLSAAWSVVRPEEDAAPFVPAVLRQTASILAMGVPLVGLVHVGLGSFLAMQAYFGGTFVDGTGAVVGVGLIRKMAPLMTGLTLAGLLAARMTPELAVREKETHATSPAPAADPAPRVDYGAPPRAPALPAAPTASERAWLAAVRLVAAVLSGLVLTLWGVLVGTVVGWRVAGMLLGVTSDIFFYMFFSMLWVRDVAGLFIKGGAFALFAAIFACHEGLRLASGRESSPVATAACRAACLAGVAILVLNSGWFLLLYHAGPAFGPTLLAPPSQ